jgi:branched-chain amino acid transport system ATP-binding protein
VELARSGIALLVVEHLMGLIEAITDRVIVMNAGKEIFEGVLADAVKDRNGCLAAFVMRASRS